MLCETDPHSAAALINPPWHGDTGLDMRVDICVGMLKSGEMCAGMCGVGGARMYVDMCIDVSGGICTDVGKDTRL